MNMSADLLQLLAGFVLTTVGGGILTFWFQWLSWRRQARLELLRQRYADGLTFVSGLMKLIDRRLFRLQQVIWALEGDAPSSLFLDFADDDRATPASLHYRFVAAHSALLRARSDKAAMADASAVVAKLNIDASDFCLMLATRFHEGAEQLFGAGSKP